MNTLRNITMVMLSLVGLSSSPAYSQSSETLSGSYVLVGATFDDGGAVIGGFSKYIQVPTAPLPEFYNIQVATTAGNSLLGSSTFETSHVCYINTKQLVCSPNANLVIYLDEGVPGQAGYDHLQIATYFAPNNLIGQVGALDPTFSYETACTQSGCLTRHITAGTIRSGTP